MLQMEKLKKDEKVANSFEMTMKEADIDQNGIQTEVCQRPERTERSLLISIIPQQIKG